MEILPSDHKQSTFYFLSKAVAMLLSRVERTLEQHCEFGVVGSTLCRRWEYDLAIQRCNNFFSTTSIVHCESNRLSNVEAVSEQLWNSSVDAVLCISCTTLQSFLRCHKVACFLGLHMTQECFWRPSDKNPKVSEFIYLFLFGKVFQS